MHKRKERWSMKLKCIIFILAGFVSSNSAVAMNSDSELCSAQECNRESKGSCQCYCSHKCGPRAWEQDDPGLYVHNDPHGKGCYCKPWDYNNFNTSDDGMSCAVKEKQQAAEEVQKPKTKRQPKNTNRHNKKKITAEPAD